MTFWNDSSAVWINGDKGSSLGGRWRMIRVSMRIKPLIIAGVSLVGAIFSTPVWASDLIRAFHVDASLSPTGEYVVHEQLDYDVGLEERHGIYRVIPRVAKIGWWREVMGLTFKEAKMEGRTTPWEASYGLTNAKLKIGDQELTFTGVRTFDFDYEIHRVIRTFEDYQELYWNVTGNAWEAPISQATFSVSAPTRPLKVVCYTGPVGSMSNDCQVSIEGTHVEVRLVKPLELQEGLTVVIAYPQGTFALPSFTLKERLLNAFYAAIEWLWIVLPILATLFSFWYWWRRGRELRGRGTVIAHYEPPVGLRPAQMEMLIQQAVSHRMISATILDLARRGFLKVVFPEKMEKSFFKGTVSGISLKKLCDPDATFLPFEKILFEGLFSSGEEVRPEDLKEVFYPTVAEVNRELMKSVVEAKMFEKDPNRVRTIWVFGAAFWVFVTFVFMFSVQDIRYLVTLVGAIPIFLFGYHMPRLSKLGAERLEEIKGFKHFLAVTEKERLAFHDAPEKTPEQFSLFLPAALAFGIEKNWAGQFASLGMIHPDYIQGGSASVWSSSLGVSSGLSSFSQTLSSSAFSAPSSGSSGGSSGGGSGGGGGGSW